jgi:hypothetical protein
MPSPHTRFDLRLRVSPGTAGVHLIGDHGDLEESSSSEMMLVDHHPTDRRQQVDVVLFARNQGVQLKLRKHATYDVVEAPRLPLERVVTRIRAYRSRSQNSQPRAPAPLRGQSSDSRRCLVALPIQPSMWVRGRSRLRSILLRRNSLRCTKRRQSCCQGPRIAMFVDLPLPDRTAGM